jgi:serine/threonine-protein phosphatase PGAM5
MQGNFVHRRDPASLVRPSKGGIDDNRYNEAVEKVKSKAVRHLLLIRHGHYNLSGKSDKERVLTDLGMYTVRHNFCYTFVACH